MGSHEDETRLFMKELERRSSALNLSQSDLARKAGVGRDAVNRWWNGKVLPSDRKLRQLARALNCSPEDLLPNRREPLTKRISPLEIRHSATDPSRAWVRLEAELSRSTAKAIYDLVERDREGAT